jgi:iron(III) transport system substrate-binding protein
VKGAAPCEGTGYEIGSLSIIKGARNLENARKFVDWALTPKAQALGAQAKQFQLPSNVGTPVSPLSPRMADVKLISYDAAKYGASAERKRLLERWEREIGSIAK